MIRQSVEVFLIQTMSIPVFFIACVVFLPSAVPQRTAAVVSSQQTNSEILPKDYSRDIAPTVDGQPVEVNVSLVILSLKPELNAQMASTGLVVHNASLVSMNDAAVNKTSQMINCLDLTVLAKLESKRNSKFILFYKI